MSGSVIDRVPAAVADDSSNVSEALEVARALWAKGDRKDAIRWVRRAAEAAADAGNVSRLATLARSAAELEEASIPPPAPSQTRAAAPRSMSPPPLPSSRPSKPASLPPSRPPTAPPPKPASLPVRQPLTTPPPAPAPPTSSVQPVSARAAREPASEQAPAPTTRVRVSVRISVRDASLFVVRPLAIGEALPPGTREAFLVMSDEASSDLTRAGGGRA
jgi:hypothetical protein